VENRDLIDFSLRRYRGRRARLRDVEDDLSAVRDRGSPRADSDITRITAPPRRLTLIPLKEEATSSGRNPGESLWNDCVRSRVRTIVQTRNRSRGLIAKKRRKRAEKRTDIGLA